MEQTFDKYAEYYDAFYQDKDYDFEAAYISGLIRKQVGDGPKDLIDFGAGTGKHGLRLASMGFNVHGVEISNGMVSRAESGKGFSIEQGDVRSYASSKKYDVALAMFHVLSYMRTLEDFESALRNIGSNLVDGGILIFDVWYGPAVLAIGVEDREKTSNLNGVEIVRKARPVSIPAQQSVQVNYECGFVSQGEFQSEFTESHILRYFFFDTIEKLANEVGLEIVSSEESFSGRQLDESTWSALFVVTKKSLTEQ
jgi:SAM-dependent methyltransferase